MSFYDNHFMIILRGCCWLLFLIFYHVHSYRLCGVKIVWSWKLRRVMDVLDCTVQKDIIFWGYDLRGFVEALNYQIQEVIF